MKTIGLLFPHQLFNNHEILNNCDEIYLIEEYLFFKQYKFHKQKIAFHRASMKSYEEKLSEDGLKVNYIESTSENSDIRALSKELAENKDIKEVHFIGPTDNWLKKRLKSITENFEIHEYENPLFLNSKEDLKSFFKADKKSFFQTTFYKQQRTKRKILLDEEGKPEGGKWTFDTENRKKYPKGKTPPPISFPDASEIWFEAVEYTEKHFASNPGELSKNPIYPINREQGKDWLKQFLDNRFYAFGDYEDAILKDKIILNHSILTPVLNVGIISPKEILQDSLAFAESNDIPINSTEGFVRQIIGWREFIRGMYDVKGSESRTKNYWNFKRKIPKSFYDGTTGIVPVDDSIKKVLKTGYCHHIERLMVLGNFMLLCEFDPDEVFKWFMELFIDAYDWVMVPNVYGMSQFADGGLFATKPYISSSNYIKKMSDYGKGDWEPYWDGLFWRFMHEHQSFFKKNPRTGMLLNTFNKMGEEKQQMHLNNAEEFLKKIDK